MAGINNQGKYRVLKLEFLTLKLFPFDTRSHHLCKVLVKQSLHFYLLPFYILLTFIIVYLFRRSWLRIRLKNWKCLKPNVISKEFGNRWAQCSFNFSLLFILKHVMEYNVERAGILKPKLETQRKFELMKRSKLKTQSLSPGTAIIPI